MSRNKRRIAAVLTGVGLAGSAAALAVPPLIEQDEVSASIVWTHASGYDQLCGPEDEFRGLTEHAIVTGVATSDDPRLSGDIQMHTVLNIAVSPSSTQVGTLRIRDRRTGEWKAQGRFAIAGEDTQSGGLVGTVRDPARPGGTVSDLIGPFSITFGLDGIVGQIGGEPATDQTPAVIARRGNCGGRKIPFEADFTSEGAAKAVGARRLGWH
jgi:hypothetical protein